jgi:hypothetical protein
MEDYIGIDVSMKEPALTIRRGGQRVWRGKCVSKTHYPNCPKARSVGHTHCF